MKVYKSKIIYILYIAFVIAFFYFSHVTYTSFTTYKNIKGPRSGWYGRVHEADEMLGFKPIPSSTGYETFPLGYHLKMKYDNNGFRIPVDENFDREMTRPYYLFLGCSFTYGAGVPAEETFPEIITNKFSGTALNGGVCASNIAHMVLLAEQYIPEFKPDFVVVQYSPWLIKRSTYFAPSFFGKIPAPYFSDKLEIQKPIFLPVIFSLPTSEYASTNKNTKDFLSFLFNVMIPLRLYEDYFSLKSEILYYFGAIDKPFRETIPVIEHSYKRILDLCNKAGSKLIIVELGRADELSVFPSKQIFGNSDEVIIAGAHKKLWDRLGNTNEDSYIEAYYNDRRLSGKILYYDPHPNPIAHSIIAESIIEAIMKSE